MASNPPRELVAAFAELGAATVYEASNLPCALDPAIKPVWSGARVCGPAFTVRCHPGDNLPIHLALEQVSQGDVLVVQGGGFIGGYWGEILTVAAQARGVAGLVIDGGVRDVEALQRLQFPVWARGAGVARTVKHDPGELGRPIVVAGVSVGPGDLVLGDSDGVLVVPRDRLETVLEASRAREAKERVVLERIRQGELTVDIYGFRR